MKDLRTTLARIAAFPTLLLYAATVHAQTGLTNAQSNINAVGKALGGNATTNTLPVLVANLINVVLGVMGIVFVGLIVYAGILYMNAGANPDNAKKAKSTIINSVIGLVIVVAAYAISNFIIGQIIGATTTTTAAG